MSTLEQVKALRERTGAGIVEVKKALTEAEGNEEKAIEILRKSGQAKAVKKGDRETKEGVIVSYIHSNNRVGALVQLYCETDFVARNQDFQDLARDIAMHITAANPKYVKAEEVTEEDVAREKEIWAEQLKNEGKPADMLEKIMAGKESKFRGEIALLSQPFIKNPDITVGDLLTENILKIGENIQVGAFTRYEL